jgi:hypothetical protein
MRRRSRFLRRALSWHRPDFIEETRAKELVSVATPVAKRVFCPRAASRARARCIMTSVKGGTSADISCYLATRKPADRPSLHDVHRQFEVTHESHAVCVRLCTLEEDSSGEPRDEATTFEVFRTPPTPAAPELGERQL